jgi:hypothetical protein
LQIVAPALTLLITMVGMGVLWGALKTQVGHLKEEVDRLCGQLDRQEIHLAALQEEVRVNFAQVAAKAPRKRRK